MTDTEKIYLLRSALKGTIERLERYAKRQGKIRMAGRSYGDGSVSNKHAAGQHYPAVQSAIAVGRHAIAKSA